MSNLLKKKKCMNDDIDGYYLDDGTRIDPNFIDKPSLCILCNKNDDPSEEVLCTLTRIDQHGESEFVCYSYSPSKKY